jgi:chromosome segregation ATPase
VDSLMTMRSEIEDVVSRWEGTHKHWRKNERELQEKIDELHNQLCDYEKQATKISRKIDSSSSGTLNAFTELRDATAKLKERIKIDYDVMKGEYNNKYQTLHSIMFSARDHADKFYADITDIKAQARNFADCVEVVKDLAARVDALETQKRSTVSDNTNGHSEPPGFKRSRKVQSKRKAAK